MGRLIIILVIIAAVVWLLASYRRRSNKPAEPAITQDMVSCARCGVHMPKGESRLVAGKYYCCDAHSRGQDE